jgi:DNA-binding response OmpR family regulator
MKLLVVEDEGKLARSLASSLERAGYAVDLAFDGEAALDRADAYDYDLVLLDIMLPKLDGFQVLKRLRDGRISAPVLMLTAREDTKSKVRRLDLGADDYLAKPFELEELLARIRALLRRDASDRSALLRIGDLVFDPAAKRVTRAGRLLALTAREYQLLEFLLRNKGRVLSRSVIYDHVWSRDFTGNLKIVDVDVNYLRSKIDALKVMVEDLLTLSRLESEDVPRSSVDLADVVVETVEQFRPVAEAKGVDLRTVEAASAPVEGERSELRRVVSNLLDNALKYTERGGSVSLALEKNGGYVSLRVRDTGTGIAPSERARIFERFYRADPSRDRRTGGAGLGLAIVARIVAIHGGRVSVESDLGKGSDFVVELPLSGASP